MPPKAKTSALAIKPDEFNALAMIQSAERPLPEIVNDFLAGQPLQVKHLQKGIVASGGGVAWKIQAGRGRPTATEEIDGVIIDVRRTRAWYKVPYEQSGGGTAPDCFSIDMVKGIGTFQDQDCATCPMNQWGSSPRGSGKGKLCGERIRLFLLRQDSLLPMVIGVPPTSLDPVEQYLIGILDKGIFQYWRALTRLTLEEADGPSGKYSWIRSEMLGTLEDDTFNGISGYREGLRPIIDQSMEEFAKMGDQAQGDVVFRDEQTGAWYRMDSETGELIALPLDVDGNPIETDDEGDAVDPAPPEVVAGGSML